jgi:hypothetical protein
MGATTSFFYCIRFTFDKNQLRVLFWLEQKNSVGTTDNIKQSYSLEYISIKLNKHSNLVNKTKNRVQRWSNSVS